MPPFKPPRKASKSSAKRAATKRSTKQTSRKTSDDARAKKAGYKSYRDYRLQRNDPTYDRFLKDAIENGANYRKARALDSEFNRLYNAALPAQAARHKVEHWRSLSGPEKRMKINRVDKPTEQDYRIYRQHYRSSKGHMSKLLAYVGLRHDRADYDVGDTP